MAIAQPFQESFAAGATTNVELAAALAGGGARNTVETGVEPVVPTSASAGDPDLAENFEIGTDPSSYRGGRYLDAFDDAEIPAALRLVLNDPRGGDRQTNLIPAFTNFFLESAQEPQQEKLQLLETLGAHWGLLYGSKPRFWSYTGTLLNSRNHDWATLWGVVYERYLRGTRAAELGAQVTLTYGGKVVRGMIVTTNTGITAGNPAGVSLAFTMVVSEVQFLRQAQALQDQYGVSDVDGIAALADLDGLDAVAARSAEIDAAAGLIIQQILAGEQTSTVAASEEPTSDNATWDAQRGEGEAAVAIGPA